LDREQLLNTIDHHAASIRSAINEYCRGIIGGEQEGITLTFDDQAPSEKQITEALRSLGVPAHIMGYSYLRDAIHLVITEPDLQRQITKSLYPAIATKYSTTPSRVERAIRHAIELAFTRGCSELMKKIFVGAINPEKEKASNAEFISTVAEWLKLNAAA
jgi:two-component system response regulator (stage 0 sporulation protein A)